ncbi:hypothetical protein [Clostridium beijerinckii]|uniref:Uncharacterized protein n=1 Tax=Clostridium beijerinckii TaxID=1520 RepID=A0A1S8S738_CLOBE|nr:hypothetical protein [Clostridium beijerinckii]NRY61484.1 hypothetical protein [Clostridium beijerinckii]OOM61271.1 hypothetical protein CLBCK_24050 [Clostridium beijerinckii]
MSKEEMNQKSMELVGVLQAISVVAKKLAQRLMRIEEEVNRREESLFSKSTSKKYQKEN